MARAIPPKGAEPAPQHHPALDDLREDWRNLHKRMREERSEIAKGAYISGQGPDTIKAIRKSLEDEYQSLAKVESEGLRRVFEGQDPPPTSVDLLSGRLYRLERVGLSLRAEVEDLRRYPSIRDAVPLLLQDIDRCEESARLRAQREARLIGSNNEGPLLTSSKDICKAIGKTREYWRTLRRLNANHGGPIFVHQDRTPPSVYLDSLVKWWNRVQRRGQER